jgi:hypothetical protein
MTPVDQARRIIDRLLRDLNDDERHGTAPAGWQFEAPDDGAIRDGEYGDPTRNTRPEWMKEQERGWESPRR